MGIKNFLIAETFSMRKFDLCSAHWSFRSPKFPKKLLKLFLLDTKIHPPSSLIPPHFFPSITVWIKGFFPWRRSQWSFCRFCSMHPNTESPIFQNMMFRFHLEIEAKNSPYLENFHLPSWSLLKSSSSWRPTNKSNPWFCPLHQKLGSPKIPKRANTFD